MTDNAGLRFLDGSSSYKSYLIIALRGDVALGIRPLGMLDGSSMGVPGKSYLHARLRSAKAPVGLAAQYTADGEENVVKLGDQKLAFDEAWPDIEFHRVDPERSSTMVGVFLRGSITLEPKVVLDRLDEEDFIGKMALYVTEKAGPENMILRPQAIAAWLHEQLDPMFKQVKAKIAATEAFSKHIDSHVEVFGFQAKLLAKLYDKHQAPSHDPDDDPDNDAED